MRPHSSIDWFAPKGFALVLGAMILLNFWDVLLGLKTFFYRDFALFGYPLAWHHRESLWAGEVPFWNPYNNCGLPFLAQWNTMVLYPGSLLYLLLPMPWSLNLFVLAHFFLAGIGMYRLAWRWTQHPLAASVAGLLFTYNGVLLSSLKWTNNIAAFGLMPWVVLAVSNGWRENRRQLAQAALLGAAQMLTGAPEVILLTWIFVGIHFLWEFWRSPEPEDGANEEPRVWLRRCTKLAAVILLVSLLAAAQLLPFLQLLTESQRDASFASSVWAMPMWGLFNFVSPLFGTFKSHLGVHAQLDQYWISSYYLPVAGLALALASGVSSKRAALLRLVLVGALWLSLGDPGWLYPIARKIIPIFGLMRYPIKFVVLAIFVLPLLAAFALASLEKQNANNRLIPVATALLIIMGLALAVALRFPFQQTPWRDLALNSVLRLGFLGAGLGALWYWLRSGSHKTAAGLVFLFVLWGDAVTHAPWQNPVVEPWVLEPGLARREMSKNLKAPMAGENTLPQPGQGRAMLTLEAERKLDHLISRSAVDDCLISRFSLFCNCNLLDKIPKLDGFYSLYLKSQTRIQSLAHGASDGSTNLQKFLSISHQTAPGSMIDWTIVPRPLPWVTAGQRPVFASESETLQKLGSAEFNPAEVVYLEPYQSNNPLLQPSLFARPASAAITNQLFRANRLKFEVVSDAPALVVISQAYYPAWRAEVNGQPTPIWKANAAFQALIVPAGRSEVVVKYQDKWFYFGAGLSALGALICVVLLVRRQPASSPQLQPT